MKVKSITVNLDDGSRRTVFNTTAAIVYEELLELFDADGRTPDYLTLEYMFSACMYFYDTSEQEDINIDDVIHSVYYQWEKLEEQGIRAHLDSPEVSGLTDQDLEEAVAMLEGHHFKDIDEAAVHILQAMIDNQ